jgi:hypothetical protein
MLRDVFHKELFPANYPHNSYHHLLVTLPNVDQFFVVNKLLYFSGHQTHMGWLAAEDFSITAQYILHCLKQYQSSTQYRVWLFFHQFVYHLSTSNYNSYLEFLEICSFLHLIGIFICIVDFYDYPNIGSFLFLLMPKPSHQSALETKLSTSTTQSWKYYQFPHYFVL